MSFPPVAEALRTLALKDSSKTRQPCFVCHVPREQLDRLDLDFPLRTKEEAMAAMGKYERLSAIRGRRAEADEVLNALSMHPVHNVLWRHAKFRQYQGIPTERLHNFDAGELNHAITTLQLRGFCVVMVWLPR